MIKSFFGPLWTTACGRRNWVNSLVWACRTMYENTRERHVRQCFRTSSVVSIKERQKFEEQGHYHAVGP